MSDRGERKLDHLRLCTAPDPGPISYPPDRGTLLDCVEILPAGFPVVPVAGIDSGASFLGRAVSAPLMVSAMTGGPSRSGEINRSLARVCQSLRIPLSLGSARPLLDDPDRAPTFDVRDEAPDVPIVANIGIAQAGIVPPARLASLVKRIRADALCVHVNFAMEALQPEGDVVPPGVEETIARLKGEVGCPLLVKEVGGGFSPGQLEVLARTGVDWIDVAGAGGTSFVAIEGLRGGDSGQRLAGTFARWGWPTAACLGWAARMGVKSLIASGGLRTGLDVARALVLGASMAGMALPVVRALDAGGEEGAMSFLMSVIREIRLATHLAGLGRTADLRCVPRFVREPLRSWLEAAG